MMHTMIYKVFDKNSVDFSTHTWTGINLENWQSSKELCKVIFKKFKKCIV